MGCDIHGLVERRVNGKWICWRTLNSISTGRYGNSDSSFALPAALERNYERFAALAGVRGEGPDPRGMPEDASETAMHLFVTYGDHTPSWLPIKDAAQIFAKTEFGKLRDFDKKYPLYFYFGLEDEQPLEEFRIVFWFDS